MGDDCIQIVHLGRYIVGYTVENFVLRRRVSTELSQSLTPWLTAIKSHVIRCCETVYETSNKSWFWSIKILARGSVN